MMNTPNFDRSLLKNKFYDLLGGGMPKELHISLEDVLDESITDEIDQQISNFLFDELYIKVKRTLEITHEI